MVGLAVAVQTVFTVVLALGASLALGGHIGAAEVLAVLVLAARCADPLLSLSDMSGQLRGARYELARLDAVLRTEPLPEPAAPVRPVRHDLESPARALLKNAPVVLLDEVTSALDPVNEAAVHEGIERLMAGRTVVMVAHRMRTVRRADRVVFLDGGRIVEEGSHDTLLRHGGRYADFWNASLPPAGRETSPAVGPRA
ncbi:hypothetical protein [Streptomyces sp. NPDC006477]|uniref:hypothetical protein n=1 Tax=Streptomyces sp. NPDC006477 TaxID=3364747 RepID=UPI0036828B22